MQLSLASALSPDDIRLQPHLAILTLMSAVISDAGLNGDVSNDEHSISSDAAADLVQDGDSMDSEREALNLVSEWSSLSQYSLQNILGFDGASVAIWNLFLDYDDDDDEGCITDVSEILTLSVFKAKKMEKEPPKRRQCSLQLPCAVSQKQNRQ